jgi:DNA-binding transcriptional MerR regulator
LYTVDTALEALKKYDITPSDLTDWESALGLEIPVDEAGRKYYSAHHINLFKNIKKHLALGRTIDEIRKIIILPPLTQSHPLPSPRPEIMSQASSYSQTAAPESFRASRNLPSQGEGIDAISRMAAASGGEIVAPQLATAGMAIPSVQTPVAQSLPQQPALQSRNSSPQIKTQQASTSTVELGTIPSSSGQGVVAVESKSDSGAVHGNESASSSFSGMAPITSTPKSPEPEEKKGYVSLPKRTVLRSAKAPAQQSQAGAATVINLVQRLTQEKDTLYKKLMETEKLNSHLYSANSLFHKKANEMSRQINQLKEDRNEMERFKLLDDKSRLHKQLLEAERLTQRKQEEILQREQTINVLQMEAQHAQKRIEALSADFNPEKFRGDWIETGTLLEVAYDNFGINIESERVRLFRISEVPKRLYGSCAIINTTYQYESNVLWQREESMSVAYTDEDTLEGELTAEYILDDVPVAKAVYRVSCRRK